MKLAYERWGSGREQLLLLHGFTGSRRAWDRLRPLLSPRVRATAVDLPGHGGSPACDSPGAEGFERTLNALEELMDELAIDQANFVGYSQGARVSLAFAFHAPQRVRRLILESGSPGLKLEQDRVARKKRDEALASGIETGGVASFVAQWEKLPLFAGLRKLGPDQEAVLRSIRLSCSAAGLASALRSLGAGVQPSYWHLLPRLRVPALLLTGARDRKYTAIARAMARELPLAWTRSFEDAWHAPHLEAPGPYAQEALGFLEARWFEAPLFDQSTEAVA